LTVDFENVEISATKNCIIFFKNKHFIIKPMAKVLNVKFYLENPNNDYPFTKLFYMANNIEHHIRISSIEEVNPQLFSFIKQSITYLIIIEQ
jgi:hypothetical protein